MNKNYSIYKILFASVLMVLSACQSDPPVISPNPIKSPNISVENPLFIAEDSCRLIPLPSPGNTGEYNDFPDKYLQKTVAHNPENSCEYLIWMTESDIPSLYYMLIDICKGIAVKYDIFPSGTDAFPVWGENEWFLFVYQKEIWKVKSNGDSLEKIIPNYNTNRYYNLRWNPNDPNSFFFTQQATSFKADVWGNQIDTLETSFIIADNESKALYSIKDESIGYYDLEKAEYVPVSSKYEREFGGSWLSDGEHFVWLVMENGRSYPISLVEFNIYTKEERVIKEWSCYNRTYTRPQVSQDGKWVYMHLQYAEHLGGRDMFGDWFTAFVNIETGEEYWGAFEPQ
jgi:hypothetical protein